MPGLLATVTQSCFRVNRRFLRRYVLSEAANVKVVSRRCTPVYCSCSEVLLAEDDPGYRRIIQGWLETWGYRVTTAQDGVQAWEIIQQQHAPHLLVLDWMMPDIEGPELCRRVRGREKGPSPYILLVTAKDGTDNVIRGLDAGADDYITKPCDIGELRARVGVGQRMLKLQNELIGAQEELRFGATHDLLTGLWNHAAILDLLGRELRRMSRYRTPMGVLMVDIDHFKQVNDTYGHLNGDLALKEVARRVEQAARSYDFVGRYGGEEFIVLLSDCHLEEIRKGGERVRLAVAATPIKVGSTEINVTVSIGAASSSDANSQQDLLARADAALYRAKENGRDRLEV